MQAEANLNQQKVNLANTIIRSPIDGIIIQRPVDVGQTVQASYQSPTLFIVAADLTKMKCTANIDESEVSKIRTGPDRAAPDRRLPDRDVQRQGHPGPPAADRRAERRHLRHGHRRAEHRVQAQAGHDGQRPIEITKRTDVVRVPNTAIRFRPTAEIFEAFNQEVPPELQQRGAPAAPPGRAPRRHRHGRRAEAPGGAAHGQGARARAPLRRARLEHRQPARRRRRGQGPKRAAVAARRRRRHRAGYSRAPRRSSARTARAPRIRPRVSAATAAPPGHGWRPAFAGGQGGQGMGGGRGGGRGFDPNDPEAAKRMLERYQAMPADQKAQYAARMKERGIDIEALVKRREAGRGEPGSTPGTSSPWAAPRRLTRSSARCRRGSRRAACMSGSRTRSS